MDLSSMRSKHRCAFTIVEVLVVVAVVTILSALILTVLGSSRGRARQSACSENLRQVFLAYGVYCQDHGGELQGSPLSILPIAAYAKSASIFSCPADNIQVPRRNGGWDSMVTDHLDESPPSTHKISYPYIRHTEPGNKMPFWSWYAESPRVGIFGCFWHADEHPSLAGHPMRADVIGKANGPVIRVHGDGHVSRYSPASSPAHRHTGINLYHVFYSPNSPKWVVSGED